VRFSGSGFPRGASGLWQKDRIGGNRRDFYEQLQAGFWRTPSDPWNDEFLYEES
jgi:hypothetical protein